jgi:hypothetical protein
MTGPLPPPGLQGDYAGSCVACFRGTDTALGYRGSLEGHTAFLMALGLSEPEAAELVREFADHYGRDERGRYGMPYRVCSDCAAKAGLPPPALLTPGAEIPVITAAGDESES